jgi:large subunit ribosomal protein L13
VSNTFMANPQNIERKWFVVDAEGKTLGRLASQVAAILRGKHKPIFTPHMDSGDFVIIVNAEKIVLTGKKMSDKIYTRYSGYPGGLKEIPAKDLMASHPSRVLEIAIKGMLPHNKLGKQVYGKLKVYAGGVHPHAAQMPEKLEI